MYRIEHIGIAVRSVDEGEVLYQRLLNQAPYKREEVPSQMVITSFFKAGESKIELLQPTDDRSPVHRFIEKRGEGIHHIAFEVDDIRAEMQRLKNEGFELLQDEPAIGADNKWVCFIHPRSAGGVLIEICQTITGTDPSL